MNKLKILNKLIGYKTDANITSFKECNDYIADILTKHGWKVKFISNPEGNKKNLFAVLNGDLCNVSDGLLLSGHIDTVATNREEWETNPFVLSRKGDVLRGLGVADMKYFTACVLSLADEINALDIKKPLLFCLTSDEETIMQGINAVANYFKQNNISPSLCLIGEPNNLGVSQSNKGFYEMETKFKGKAAHSSNPCLGVNAVYMMSKLISFIENLSKEYYPNTTINVGKITGGKMCNIVPDTCSIRWDIRSFSRKDVEDIQNKVNKYCEQLCREYEGSRFTQELAFKIPVFEYKESKQIAKIKDKYALSEKPYKAATEAGFFQELGIDCFIFGAGDIEDAHSVNEKLDLNQMNQFSDYLMSIIKDFCCW